MRILESWENYVKGSARKISHPRKNVKFAEEQQNLVEECFDVGEQDKKKRYTTSSCKSLILEKLGERFVLSENQIAAYWSNYRKRKKDSVKQKQSKKQKLN